MKTELPFQLIDDLKKLEGWEYLSDIPAFVFSWYDDHKKNNVKVDTSSTSHMTVDLIKKLYDELKKRVDDGTYQFPLGPYTASKYRTLSQKIKWIEKNGDVENASKLMIKNLKGIVSTIETWVNSIPEQQLYFYYETESYGQQPFLMTGVRFHPASQYQSQHVSITLENIILGKSEQKSIYIYNVEQLAKSYGLDKKDLNIEEFFDAVGMTLIDQDSYSEYKTRLTRTMYLSTLVGKVYNATVIELKLKSGYYETTKIIDTRVDKSTSPMIILDTPHYIDKNSSSSRSGSSSEKTVAKPAFRPDEVSLPIHTIVAGFHLGSHKWCKLEIETLTEHVFQGPELMNKLIIDDMDKNIVNMLIEESKLDLEDIVAGKQGGSFLLGTGAPGTGKTLTAEIMAEALGLPLYTIQCSQLGLDPIKIEENLSEVLHNAERWNAILQLDEADVYIRERGLDIAHNAIVGAFLRILEKAKCIMFMTTNISSIDDAILSRATAVLRYKKPQMDKLLQIFKVLSDQFKVEVDFDIQELFLKKIKPEAVHSGNTSRPALEIYNDQIPYSGRDVKSFMKLARMRMSHKNEEKLSYEDAEMILTYIK